jgi:inosine-uridine nucleoside N-ribohydrolase
MNVIFSTDADFDDISSLLILLLEHIRGNICLIGIVLEDGMFSYPLNESIVGFFLNFLKLNIPMYKSIPRSNNRDYPPEIKRTILKYLSENFGYKIGMKYKRVSDVYPIFKHRVSILTTGNVTTITEIISQNIEMIDKVVSMIGNYKVKGNIIGSLDDAEYNAYLDPISFQKLIKLCKSKLWICPLDCTNYVPMTENRINKIQSCTNVENYKIGLLLNRIYEFNINMIYNINDKLYMWDQVAALLFLNKNIGQKHITIPINVNNNGKIIYDRFNNFNTNVYIYVDEHKFDKEICKLFNYNKHNYIFIIFLFLIIFLLYLYKIC